MKQDDTPSYATLKAEVVKRDYSGDPMIERLLQTVHQLEGRPTGSSRALYVAIVVLAAGAGVLGMLCLGQRSETQRLEAELTASQAELRAAQDVYAQKEADWVAELREAVATASASAEKAASASGRVNDIQQSAIEQTKSTVDLIDRLTRERDQLMEENKKLREETKD